MLATQTLKNLLACTSKRFCSTVGSLSASRDLLSQYPGGKVTCHKDTTSGIAVITLDQPQRKNALTGTMMIELSEVVSSLEEWEEGKGVIVHGAEGTLCSGGDLTLMKDIMRPDKGVTMSRIMQDSLTRLYQLPLLSVALVEGSALGGGAEIAVSCDLRLATSGARIGFVQSRMGVSPGWGGGVKLVELLGRRKALKVLLSGRVFSPEEALELGLLDDVLEQTEQPVEAAKQWMTQYLKSAPLVGHVAKEVVLSGMNFCMADALEEERELFAKIWGGPAQKQAVQSKIKHTD